MSSFVYNSYDATPAHKTNAHDVKLLYDIKKTEQILLHFIYAYQSGQPSVNVGKQQGINSNRSTIAVAAKFIREPNCRNK